MLNTFLLSMTMPFSERLANFETSLEIMLKGWGSIFIVLGLIAILVTVMTKIQSAITNTKQDNNKED